MGVDEYRARAERYDGLAKQVRSSGARQAYENLARLWRELAKQAESRERANAVTSPVVR
jgi:hypothetical protein